ncbi:hypothetical protein FRC20_003642 [Serendipita sp. 405]|nr:hypothetical protein FRC20_003642 [Serendipita sp. 405]
MDMATKPPRLRRRQQPPPSSSSLPTSSSSSGPNLGPLSVSTLAGLVAAAFALFILGIWLAIILIRRRRRRRRQTVSTERRKDKGLPDEATEPKLKISNNTETGPQSRIGNGRLSKAPYGRIASGGEEYKYDPNSALGYNPLPPSCSVNGSKPSDTPPTHQSIVIPSLTPISFPYATDSPSWNPPTTDTPIYSTPTPASQTPSTPSQLRYGQSRSTQNGQNTAGPSSSSSPAARPPMMRARTPSQLSKSFSVVDVGEVADMPQLPTQTQESAVSRSRSQSNKPRKLEKRRRSASLRRPAKSEESDRDRVSTGEKPRESPANMQQTQHHLLHHTPSFTLPLSDSDQSTKTIVPSRPKQVATTASANPPSAYNNATTTSSSGPTLTRQRSGIRQPGDANHLRPPKEVTTSSYMEDDATLGELLSQIASPNGPSQGASTSLLQHPAAPATTSLPEPSHGQQSLHPKGSQMPQQSLLPYTQLYSSDSDVLAYHKAAGNMPKPFKPFAFQFPKRSPAVSSTSTHGQSRPSVNLNNNDNNTTESSSTGGAGAGAGGSNNPMAALLAAAGLSTSPVNSPSPSPIGRISTSNRARGSTDGLSAATPWRPSTDGLTAFPPRSSTDPLSNFGNGPIESRQSLQSGYSFEVPWETQPGGASSPSAFSFSTDLYGYGGPGPASASNSIDLYRPVDPGSLVTGNSHNNNNNGGADIEGRHSLSLLGGEPLTAAELESRGLRMRRFREGHASVSSFAALNMPIIGDEARTRTRTPSWTLEALRENLFGPAHRRGQDSIASSSVGSQRSSIMPWLGLAAAAHAGPPALLASPRDANFQFAVGAQGSGSQAAAAGALAGHPYGQWNNNQSSQDNYHSPLAEPKVKTVVRAFAPLLPDELVLRPGEELVVLQEFDDGWCVVAREGLGSNGAPTPPGLDNDDVGGDAYSTTAGSSSSRGKRVIEMGTCPSWVFDEPAFAGDGDDSFARPMRSTSLGITVSVRLPAASSVLGGSIRGSPASSHMPLASIGGTGQEVPLSSRSLRITPPVREEVIRWSNF